MTAFTTPRDEVYREKAKQSEFQLQGKMDAIYTSRGFEIISRDGNLQHDLKLLKNGKEIKVEEKYRTTDHGDLLIELIQDLVSNNEGWFYIENPDILSYIIHDELVIKRIYWIQFSKFKNWWFEFLQKNRIQKAIISPKGFGLTLNLSISWNKIPKNIYERIDL